MGNRLIFMILVALKRYSSKEEPLSLDSLGSYVFGNEDYKENKGNRDKSMQRALKELQETFAGNEELQQLYPISEAGDFKELRKYWRLYYNQSLSESETNTILLAVLQCANRGNLGLDGLVEKVFELSGMRENPFAASRLEGIILEDFEQKSYIEDEVVDVMRNIRMLYQVICQIEDDSPWKVSFRLFGYDRQGGRTAIRGDYIYIVSPLYITVNQGRFWLICITNHHDNISFYPLDLMGDLQKREGDEAIDVRTIFPDWETNKSSFLREHMGVCYDEPRAAYLKFKKQDAVVYTRIYNTFCDDFSFEDDIARKLGDDWDVIRVKRSPYGLIQWVFQNAQYISFVLDEAVIPAKDFEDTKEIAKEVKEKIEQFCGRVV